MERTIFSKVIMDLYLVSWGRWISVLIYLDHAKHDTLS